MVIQMHPAGNRLVHMMPDNPKFWWFLEQRGTGFSSGQTTKFIWRQLHPLPVKTYWRVVVSIQRTATASIVSTGRHVASSSQPSNSNPIHARYENSSFCFMISDGQGEWFCCLWMVEKRTRWIVCLRSPLPGLRLITSTDERSRLIIAHLVDVFFLEKQMSSLFSGLIPPLLFVFANLMKRRWPWSVHDLAWSAWGS